MTWIVPDDVSSPAEHWKLDAVVYDEGEGSFAVATGSWEGEPRFGVRWNGTESRPLGTPQARNNATWLIVPPDFGLAIAQTVLSKSEADHRSTRDGAAAAVLALLERQADLEAI